jgi:tripartite-type tricarboxylate transporter receptor subunit TctC
VIASLGAALPLSVLAQSDYPTKPVKFIVPFPPGGTSDIMGRMAAEELGKILKQPFVVENIGGAGGVIGTERALKAAPDGYTIVMTGVGQNAVAHGLDPKPKYNSNTDFVHISQIHSGPNVLVVHPETPFKTLKDLVDFARKNPGKLDYGYTPAASGHMAMEQFKQTAGIFMLGIPYRGGGPMMTDMLGGTIKLMFINQDVALQHVKAGKLRALAVAGDRRAKALPDVPTVAESGFPGYEANTWNGMLAPAGTPRAIVLRLNKEMLKILGTREVIDYMTADGAEPAGGTPDEFAAYLRSEHAKWAKVIRDAKISKSN